MLAEGIEQRAFPGAACAVVQCGKLAASRAVGRFTYEPDSPALVPGTIFDLASLTKPVATTTMAMLLYERGQLDLDVPLAGILPGFLGHDPRRAEVTVRMLLEHSSGLPAYLRLFESAATPAHLLAAALAAPLEAEPGTRSAYSDIGFILLGEALPQVADEPLDRFCRREIFGPLGMTDTLFCPPAELRPNIPPSEDDRSFRRRVLQGEVHDENASVLGGVAGHAGLFAPAGDLARFAHCLLAGGAPLLRADTVALFTRRSGLPGSSWGLGWDTPSPPSQSGRHFSPRAFGHLGYTGTSLWIDPERELAVVLLTHRTWPDRRSQKIKEMRPRFHDAVVEALTQ
ncbi:MAG TPA: serine hydrolase domain-containing protein [Terriglobales bacterium]|nr:serine hydrolase domain-containing protein [Terriglobales bacterium]